MRLLRVTVEVLGAEVIVDVEGAVLDLAFGPSLEASEAAIDGVIAPAVARAVGTLVRAGRRAVHP